MQNAYNYIQAFKYILIYSSTWASSNLLPAPHLGTSSAWWSPLVVHSCPPPVRPCLPASGCCQSDAVSPPGSSGRSRCTLARVASQCAVPKPWDSTSQEVGGHFPQGWRPSEVEHQNKVSSSQPGIRKRESVDQERIRGMTAICMRILYQHKLSSTLNLTGFELFVFNRSWRMYRFLLIICSYNEN